MINKSLTSFIFFLIMTVAVMAQKTKVYTHDKVTYQKALSLYNSEQYLASQHMFEKIKRQADDEEVQSDCSYYIANCAVRLNQINADELMEDFVDQYPTSTKRNEAFKDVGDFYFRNSKYSHALKWFDKVEEHNLGAKEKEHFYFKKGYSLFHSNQKKKAQKYFNYVSDSEVYGAQAKYYLGYIAYDGDDYKEATSYFDQVKDQERYQEKMAYFQADMNFKLGNFDKAIDLANQRLPLASDDNERSELNKIIGESFFNLKQYDKALPHLKEYKGKKGKWTNTDHYQLGYVYFKRNEFEAAISEFNKIVDGQNGVAQNAYYHLAECYLETGKKQQALNAFRNASEMPFNKKIQQDAWLNYAKLSYEIGNPYQPVPEVLAAYIKAYPESEHNEELERLLIDSYITSKNYKEAIVLLENKRGHDYRVAYQKVAFYRALELFTNGLYADAKAHFEKVLAEPKTERFTARAQFWNAECDYLLDNYSEALIGFKQFKLNDSLQNYKEATRLNYHIGYTYFKQKEYAQAIGHFEKALEENKQDVQRLNDTYLRLGDSYFVTTDYWKAMETYNKAKQMNVVDADYAHFQKAIAYGFVGKNDEKIKDLKLFLKDFATSQYKDDALFELGNTYVLTNQPDLALRTFDELNYGFPKSSYVARSMLKQGLVHYNRDHNEQALNKFKQVASGYPGSAEAMQAVSTARLIYVDLGRVDEYVAWVKQLDYIEVTDADLDHTTYEAAEKKFLEQKTKEAIIAFKKYIAQFPEGLHATQSNFYLAQLYFKEDLKNESIPHYQYVNRRERNEFTEQSLARLSQVYLEQKQWSDVLVVLLRLETEADFPQNIVFAQSNLMKSYYELELYAESVTYAEKVLANPKVEDNVKSDAQVIIARAAMKGGDEAKAERAYATLKATAKGALAAEATYYQAYFKHKYQLYKQSNEGIQELTRDYSGYKYFASKGLVLMAKNFYQLEDAYQATYILEKVIENFSQFEDVVEEAKTTLQKIKEEEAKRNSSIDVTPEETPADEE